MILLYNLICLLINKFLEIIVSQARWRTTCYYLFSLGFIELLKDRPAIPHLSLINETVVHNYICGFCSDLSLFVGYDRHLLHQAIMAKPCKLKIFKFLRV